MTFFNVRFMYAPKWTKANGWSFCGWKTIYVKPILIWYGWLTPEAKQVWEDNLR